jgi:hypothetical protein
MLRFVPLAGQADIKSSGVGKGHFERGQFAPGPWRVELYRRVAKTDGPVLASRDVQVKAGETATLELAVP